MSLPHQNASAHLALALSVAHTTSTVDKYFSCGYFINIDREDRPGDRGSGHSCQPLHSVVYTIAGYMGGYRHKAAAAYGEWQSEWASYLLVIAGCVQLKRPCNMCANWRSRRSSRLGWMAKQKKNTGATAKGGTHGKGLLSCWAVQQTAE